MLPSQLGIWQQEVEMAQKNTVKRRKPGKKIMERAGIVSQRMQERYPSTDRRGYLEYQTPFQLVIATLLSAQATDKSVNAVTPVLFSKWPTPQDLASADVSEVEDVIRSIGLYKTKAKRCIDCARTLLEEFDGEVPQDIDALQKLPGVGRKTANIVMNDAFHDAQGVAVDTHVGRIARKLGFSKETDPSKVEQDILRTFPESEWPYINKRWIAFGREICHSRNPECSACFLNDVCPSVGKAETSTKTKK